MSKLQPSPSRKSGGSANIAGSVPGDGWRWLTHIALALAVGLVIARAAMFEFLREAWTATPGQVGAGGPGPGTAIVLDMLSAIPVLLILARRAFDGEFRLRLGWSESLFGALGVWAAVSVVWSADKYLAALSAGHLLAGAAILWTAVQLVGDWLKLRLVASVAFGLLLVLVAHGILYKFVDVPNTAAYWQSNRDQIIKQNGWEPGSFVVHQFEQKILNGEMVGFTTSPNSYAGVIVLLGLVTAGIAIQRWSNREPREWMMLYVAALAGAVLVLTYTRCRAACATPVGGGMLLLMAWRWRRWLSSHATLAYWVGVAVVLALAGSVAAYGMIHGTLFHDSLNFRWRYWVASAMLFKAHWLRGVGWGNFGPYYLTVRLPAASEEIKDPHNFVIRAIVELGLVGGLLILGWLLRSAWELTRPSHPPSPANTRRRCAALPVIVALGVVGFSINIVCAIDWNQDVVAVMLDVFRRLLLFCMFLIGGILGAVENVEDRNVDAQPAPWVLIATIISLGMFLVHNLIEFALFEVGPMFAFMLLLGAALGVRRQTMVTAWRGARMAGGGMLVAGVAGLVILGVLWVCPVVSADAVARDADDLVRAQNVAQGAEKMRLAFAALPLNSEYAFRAARYAAMAHEDDQVRNMLAAAIASDPMEGGYYMFRATWELSQPQTDFSQVQEDFRQALRLNPMDVSARLQYADALGRFGFNAEAREQYELGLDYDRQLLVGEPKRLTEEQIRAVQAKIARL